MTEILCGVINPLKPGKYQNIWIPCRGGGDIGLFITLVFKGYYKVFQLVDITTLGTFIEF